MCVQRWEGALQRGYVLHRARRVHEDSISREQAPGAPVSAYLRARAERGGELPRVHIELQAVAERRTTQASTNRGVRKGVKASEEEKGATLEYVIHDLVPELYIELLAG